MDVAEVAEVAAPEVATPEVVAAAGFSPTKYHRPLDREKRPLFW